MALVLGLSSLATTAAVEAASGGDTTLEWYGYFRLDMARDSAVSHPGNHVLYVKPHGVGDATSTVNVTARQTRLGLRAKRDGMSGRFEADFYGSSPENKNTIMLRHAYVAIPLGAHTLLAGQTSDLISPLNPLTVNYSVVWGAGNTGYRRPQARLYRETESYYYGISLARNINGDLDGDTVVDGEASAVPVVMGRVALSPGATARGLTVGTWGHYGRSECGGGGGGCPNGTDYTSWSLGGDLTLKLGPKWKLLGELYTGSNMGPYAGAIYNSDTVDGVRSTGGWANLQFPPTPAVLLSLGASIDDVDAADLAAVPDARERNAVAFGAARYEISPGVLIELELSRWMTDYANASAGRDASPANTRLQWSVQGNF